MSDLSTPSGSIFEGPNGIEPLTNLAPRFSATQAVVSTALSTAVGLIPVVGGSIATVIAGGIDAANSKKQADFFAEVGRRLDIVSDAVAHMDLGTAASDPRFAAAFMATYQQMLSEHDEEKIRWLATAAVNSGSWSPLSDMQQRYFLGLALSWQPEQVQLLAIMGDDFMVWREERREQWENAPESSVLVFMANELYGPGDWARSRFEADYQMISGTTFVEYIPAMIVPMQGGSFQNSRLTDLGESFFTFLTSRL
jgi:hypothetical protein